MANKIEIRECLVLDELAQCVDLQRQVFTLPEVEISPVRHFVVTKNAGGFTLGAFAEGELIGFVLSVPAFLRGERAFYSHMTAVRADYQGSGIGAQLKWAQRERALKAGVKYIKWTFEPWKARNAFFNLEKLGAIVSEYEVNFYGIDYGYSKDAKIGLASDRLFAEWHLDSKRVISLFHGENPQETAKPVAEIEIPYDWAGLVKTDPRSALAEQERIRSEFQSAFSSGLIARRFIRDSERPRYLLFSQ
ncbi:MAG: GNAT family N-acetyltransferase [Pyrinomonadaceae bacterium]